jgi:putative nucleotidyltransferase with HDIG domain
LFLESTQGVHPNIEEENCLGSGRSWLAPSFSLPFMGCAAQVVDFPHIDEGNLQGMRVNMGTCRRAGGVKAFAQSWLKPAKVFDDEGGMISAAKEPVKCVPLERAQIDNRLKGCACLPSLSSIDSALKELLSADQRYTSQIAEIIRRDPSLTARLLRLVNSVYYGISTPVKNIEEAVFYLGVRQIRQLAVVTPIIEDLMRLAGNNSFDWREFWRHSIGTALMTRDVIDIIQSPNEETDYVGGLIHDVGKIVMASAFPEHFRQIYGASAEGGKDLLEREREVLGVDHAELGAMYLKKQVLPEVFVNIVQFHHQPDRSRENGNIVAAVQVADLLVRHGKIGKSGNTAEVAEDGWVETAGWQILFGRQNGDERAITRASLKRSLERIPIILEGLV